MHRMKHDPTILERPGNSALRRSLQRSLERTMQLNLLAVLGGGAAAGALASALGASGPLPVAAAILAVGAGAGLAASRALSRRIAGLSARPVEMIAGQPEIGQDLGSEQLNWSGARTLSRSEIEADLDVLNRLVRRAARRSRDTLAELEQARARANQENIAKSQFLANMSHELRTPLNAILGYAMLLHEDALEAGNEASAADLERIQLAGRNLLTVINDILDLAKIESGKTSLNRSVINLRELTEAAVASFPARQRNGNRVEVSISDDVGLMIGDPGKVRQCLLNLLSNALKFTHDGQVSVAIAAGNQAGAPSVTFSVRDTGIGIEAEHLEQLFDAFNQVERDSVRRFGGTGLGLAITRRLARMMGGDCTVESARGEGSTFRLTLPLSPHAPDQSEVAPAPSELNRLPATRRSDRSVLVVDDDEAAIDLLRRWVEPMGYDVFAATDGEAGLAMAREHRPDVILLDALMPGRSGYEILGELRADPEVGETPVILITVDDDRERGLRSGACDYLRKPVSEDELRSVLDVYRRNSTGDILVIEDDDDSAELIKRSVEQVGFSTRRATNGLDALKMASDAPPAAIVLDIVMPGLDGFAVIDRLSADNALAKIPVIVLSGYDMSLVQHRKLADAGLRFFTKGVATPREIAESLLEVVA